MKSIVFIARFIPIVGLKRKYILNSPLKDPYLLLPICGKELATVDLKQLIQAQGQHEFN